MSLDCTVYLGPYAEVCLTEGAPSWGDFAEQIKHALRCCRHKPGYHFWYPYVLSDPPRDFMCFDPRQQQVMQSFDDYEQLEKEVAWFKKAFGGELRRLRAAYGATNVTIRWGLLSVIY